MRPTMAVDPAESLQTLRRASEKSGFYWQSRSRQGRVKSQVTDN